MSKVVHVRNVTKDAETELLNFASQFGIVKASKYIYIYLKFIFLISFFTHSFFFFKTALWQNSTRL